MDAIRTLIESNNIEAATGLDHAHTLLFLHSIFENIPDMIFVKDAKELRFVRFNRAGEELLGYSRDELLGKNDFDFFPEEEAKSYVAADRQVLESGQMLDIPEEKVQTRHQGIRILHTIKIPLMDEEGHPEYLLGISEDITDQKRVEEEYAAAEAKRREIMERTDRLNTIGLLAAGMAHEINNPLQAILSHLAQARRGLTGDPKAMTSLDMVERGVETIASLIDKLLTLGGSSANIPNGADCGKAVRFVRQLTESQMSRVGITFEIEGSPPSRALQIGEKELIQVLLNLLINARDAMPDGGTVCVQCSETESECRIAVRDTGKGISPEILPQLFTPFFTTKGARGTGLGLVVALSLIQTAGGTIEADSTPGQGAIFTLHIPFQENPS